MWAGRTQWKYRCPPSPWVDGDDGVHRPCTARASALTSVSHSTCLSCARASVFHKRMCAAHQQAHFHFLQIHSRPRSKRWRRHRGPDPQVTAWDHPGSDGLLPSFSNAPAQPSPSTSTCASLSLPCCPLFPSFHLQAERFPSLPVIPLPTAS